jgi:ubiquitin-protein ligase
VTPRLRRLDADFNRVMIEFMDHPMVHVEPLGPVPPERYHVSYDVPGARWDEATDGPMRCDHFEVLITLTQDYPRREPVCTMLSPVFHPNIGEKYGIDDYICINDVWTPTQELFQVVAKVGEILQYQTYNVDSPLDTLAARWAMDYPELLPLGDVTLYQGEAPVVLGDEYDGDDEDGAT